MRRSTLGTRSYIAALGLSAIVVAANTAHAEVRGVPGTPVTLTAKADRISTPDGNSIYFWGFAAGAGRAQYPGPTLIVDQDAEVQVTVVNELPAGANQRISLSFPGQTGVKAECASADPASCIQGPLTLEAAQGGRVLYTFRASRPGTFIYNSGSRPDLQVEMGLTGAMIVRPKVDTTAAACAPAASGRGYSSAESCFDQEYLFFLTEMDSIVHDVVEMQGVEAADKSGRLANYFSNYWFINGRNAPDTMADADVARLPTQPYNSLPRTHPGDRVLMRVAGGGRDMHPFHHHGNHARVIAMDGFEMKTASATTYDLSHEVFTIQSLPGQTVDALFRWTGKDIGWDVYGTGPDHVHGCGPVDSEGLDTTTREYCGDHGKPLPVSLPDKMSLTFGGFWSGSPFLGTLAELPAGQGGLNPNAGYTYMWHSHTEKEITNYDIFPGGMMTMLIVEPMGTSIP